jgi:hypothetical protein
MEKSRKYLKVMSEIILICLAFSFIRTILEVLLVNVNVDNASNQFIIIAKIMLCVIYAVLYLPQVYIGVKGIKVAKNPDSSKAHIVWAVIFIVFAVFAAISAVSGLIKAENVTENIFGLIDAVIDLGLYFFYVKFAKQVLAKAQCKPYLVG